MNALPYVVYRFKVKNQNLIDVVFTQEIQLQLKTLIVHVL